MDTKKKITYRHRVSILSIKNFPDSPGVYLMKDKADKVLYVGKASSLHKRVSAYFQKPANEKIQSLLLHIADIDYIPTSSGAQAIFLENALIKKYKPYYNATLKDDKSYPVVKISTQEAYPCLTITRGKKEKRATYYGPYTNVKLLKKAIKTLRRIFPFRSCRRLPNGPCLYLHLELCPGMCTQKVDQSIYRENLRQLGLVLEGRQEHLLQQLSEKMQQAAKNESFEEAAGLRDKISSLSEIVAQTKGHKTGDIIAQLQKDLHLTKPPYRIEAFDISEVGGEGLSGSMVSFLAGLPDKEHYRKFRIKTVKGIDDYAMIREVLRRRYSKIAQGNMPASPDLVLIDGGKGHLSSAQKELQSLGWAELPVIALAKRRETIYTPSGKAINLPPNSKSLHLLQKIRDEAHRFAIAYHHQLRTKGMRASSLDEISGIGPKRKQSLLRHFKSIQELKKATVEDLLKIKNIDKKTAENVWHFFSRSGF